jgi:NDP-sugar pyrophosphorylase family protein
VKNYPWNCFDFKKSAGYSLPEYLWSTILADMERVELLEKKDICFVDSRYIKAGRDEYWFRNLQVKANEQEWRHLRADEIVDLVKNGNVSSDWSRILVKDPFDTSLINQSRFIGLVRIGKIDDRLLKYHDFIVPQGIEDSMIISCDIGDNCAVHHCSYLSHYILQDRVILHQVDEMQTTDHAKFGVGVVKEGENESVRVTVDIMNEAGNRKILPFVSMTCADAWLWGSYRTDTKLMEHFTQFTEATIGTERGWYGIVGSETVIKSCRTIKDVMFGPCCYAKGANKLKNLTVSSSRQMPSQIGEGVELVNGIIGGGCHIFYGCKAVRFVMMDNTNLKYGARLINSVLGDNSTVSCCEVLNNLVFPGHEQHHNNSFLIASNIQGLSNMAAGSNIGSNHNSRGADGELVAERGFWPALSSTLKHNCFFASYTLIAKGNYPSELHIMLPFCLLSSNDADHRLLMPAYWWMYNLYALERNSYKIRKRDRRVVKRQEVIADYLAPDTANEILKAEKLLCRWTAQAWLRQQDDCSVKSGEELLLLGRQLLEGEESKVDSLVVIGENIENSKDPVEILKVYGAYKAYGEMLLYYAVKTIAHWCLTHGISVSELENRMQGDIDPWLNLGGQLVPESKVNRLREKVNTGVVCSWDDMHAAYATWFAEYEDDKVSNALGILKAIKGTDFIDASCWDEVRGQTRIIRSYIEKQVYVTKSKDYKNPFRSITFRNDEERDIVLGKVDENPFIEESARITQELNEELDAVRFS